MKIKIYYIALGADLPFFVYLFLEVTNRTNDVGT